MNDKNKVLHVEITPRTIFFTLFIIVAYFFLQNLLSLFINLFIAFIFMSALKPSVDYLVKNRIPRVIASVLIVILSISSIVAVFVFAIPPLVNQSVEFVVYLSKQTVEILQRLDKNLTPGDLLQLPTVTQNIQNLTGLLSQAVLSIFSNTLNLMSIFFFTLYFLLGIGSVEKTTTKFLSKKQETFFLSTLRNVERQLGSWMRAEFVLMLIIGFFSYIGLTILNVKYALPLAVIAGFLEIFPIIGPIVSAIPAFIVAASSSTVLGVAVIGLYTIIQQLENNLIVPLIMKRAVGIPPLAVLISVYVGQTVAGISGVVLAVPFVATVIIVIQELWKYQESEKSAHHSTQIKTPLGF